MAREFRYQAGDDVRVVTVTPNDGGYEVHVGDQVLQVSARLAARGRLDLELNGRRLSAYVARGGQRRYVGLAGDTWTLQPPEPRRGRSDGRPDDGSLTATMPGRVLDVLVAEGESVQKGDTLVLLEAMKMELRVQAPSEGRVARVLCAAGQVVERGQLLLELQETS
ncbi:MAG: biotin/lipoyl-containing protein [Caldilineaceae bacterium]